MKTKKSLRIRQANNPPKTKEAKDNFEKFNVKKK